MTRALIIVLYVALVSAAVTTWQGTVTGALLWLGLEIGFWALFVRAFRSTREARDPARPWWRCTYLSVTSWWLAVFMLLGAVSTIVNWDNGTYIAPDPVGYYTEAAATVAFCTCMGALFMISGHRLHQAEKAAGMNDPVHWKDEPD
ncbi:hypothetical protein [Agromyces sp. S2-1-8]|uniref:hypothetical protein n=1 Tax=Agromyces sp. S2-1-8 TaxID=2897180 RepID=UPI001E3D6119|nr:hypothetical protein [Agromyces sp. S2-1-8]MCD5348399.1 hypothetical protein [Agromyces sp. S2-1-8]